MEVRQLSKRSVGVRRPWRISWAAPCSVINIRSSQSCRAAHRLRFSAKPQAMSWGADKNVKSVIPDDDSVVKKIPGLYSGECIGFEKNSQLPGVVRGYR